MSKYSLDSLQHICCALYNCDECPLKARSERFDDCCIVNIIHKAQTFLEEALENLEEEKEREV